LAPSAIEAEIARQYQVKAVGRVKQVEERYYAITVERRLTHPGVVALTATAKATLEG
jgi:LysR family transcriptional activator of nhaA